MSEKSKEGEDSTFDKMDRRDFLTVAGSTVGGGALGAAATETTLATSHGSTVTIIEYDKHQPHVIADDLYSICYGNGYIQAWHRLFQMDVLRHMARGQSTEMIGKDRGDLNQDIQVTRDLYNEDEIESMWQNAPSEMKTMIQGFTDGVNRTIAEMKGAWDIYPHDGDLPGEYMEWGGVEAPDNWNPQDSVAIMGFLLAQFGVGGGNELDNAQTLAELKDNIGSLEEAYNAYEDINWLRVPEEHNASIDSSEKVVEGGEEVPDFGDVPDEQFDFIDAAKGAEFWGVDCSQLGDLDVCETFNETNTASNVCVIDGQHTETGSPMIFGGPQMGMFHPPVIYEIGMHGADYNVNGCCVVGTPGVVFGRTPNFSWSVTSARQDHSDVIAVEIDPDNKSRYKWGDEWHWMEWYAVDHEDKDGSWIISQNVCRINEDGHTMPVLAINEEANVAWAKKTTTRYDEVKGAFQWTQLGRKNNRSEFESAIDDFPFSFNFFFASNNEIAMYSTGKVPDERVGSWDPRLPVPGAEHEWNGYLKGRDMGLEVVNPSSGIITNWNNAPTVGWRAGDGENQWGSVHRNDYLRDIPEWFLSDGPISLQDMQNILWYSASWGTVQRFSAPRLVEGARTSSNSTINAMADALETWGQDYNYDLNDWEYDGTYWDAGVAIWEEVRKELQDLIFRQGDLSDATPDLVFEPPQSSDPHAADLGRTTGANLEVTFNDVLDGNTNYDWLNGQNLDDVIVQAFSNAANTLANQFGTWDVSQWLRGIHWNEFQAIGWQDSESIAMQNRGTYSFINARGEGLSGAMDVLPPTNIGYVTDDDIIWNWISGYPDRLTEQLGMYDRPFEFKPMPVTSSERQTHWDQAGVNWFDLDPNA